MTAPDTAAAVLAALPTGDGWATPREVADATGKGYSTVTAVLRSLETTGDAQRQRSATGGTVWQATATADHAVVGDIDTAETAPAVDLSGDALTLAGAGINTAPADAAVSDDRVAAVDIVAPATVDLTPATGSFTTAAGADPFDHTTYAADQAVVDDLLGQATGNPMPDPGYLFASAPQTDESWTPLGEARPVSAPPAPGASLDDVLGFMTAVRPVPAAVATDTETRTPRPRTARTDAPTRRNDWGNGGLQPAILAWFAQHPDGYVAGPSEIGTALEAHTSSVAYSLKQLTKKGRTVRLDGAAPRFRVATGDGAVNPADGTA